MLELRISRFDKALDKYSYYKPYFYENLSDFVTLNDILEDVKDNDPYFDFEVDSYVKVNRIVTKLDEKLSEVIARFGKELYILPLDEFRASKDLIIDKSAFEEKFSCFPCAEDIHKEFYSKLLAQFYSTEVPYVKEDFIGNSGFIFAKYLLQRKPECQNAIIKMLKKQLPFYSQSKVFREEFSIEEDIKFLDKVCGYKRKERKKEVELKDFLNKDFDADFSSFTIAVYNDSEAETLVRKAGAKVADFVYEDLDYCPAGFKEDEKTVLELAGRIIFEAYDSGADFLLVNSDEDFDFFDGKSSALSCHKNRDLENFYVIKMSEFLALAENKINDDLKAKLKAHKLKVGLLA